MSVVNRRDSVDFQHVLHCIHKQNQIHPTGRVQIVVFIQRIVAMLLQLLKVCQLGVDVGNWPLAGVPIRVDYRNKLAEQQRRGRNQTISLLPEILGQHLFQHLTL